MRSGTINVPGIAGLGVAAAEAYAHLAENASICMNWKHILQINCSRLAMWPLMGKQGMTVLRRLSVQVFRCSFGSIAAFPRRPQHLCVSGKCMLFQSSITVRHIAEYWTGSCASGIYRCVSASARKLPEKSWIILTACWKSYFRCCVVIQDIKIICWRLWCFSREAKEQTYRIKIV